MTDPRLLRGSTYGLSTLTVNVILHRERVRQWRWLPWPTRWMWWAESPNVPGWYAADHTEGELRAGVIASLRFHLGDQTSAIVTYYDRSQITLIPGAVSMNDHHSGLTGADLAAPLLDALDKYERANCNCCSPTPLDDLFDELGIFADEDGEMSMDSDAALAARLHRFALELALTTVPRSAATASDEERTP